MTKQKWLFHGCSMAADFYETMYKWEDLPWDPEKHDNRSYPFWLSQMYDIDFVNLAYGGNDNETILTESIDYVMHHDDVDGVCIGLSGWERFYFFGMRRNVNTVHHALIKKLMDRGVVNKDTFKDVYGRGAELEYQRLMKELDKLSKVRYNSDVVLAATESIAHKEEHAIRFWTITLRRLITLQRVCDLKNIPLIVAQNIPPLYDQSGYAKVLHKVKFKLEKQERVLLNNAMQDNEYIRLLIKTSEYFKQVEEIEDRGNIWGWPFFDEWNGRIVSRSRFLLGNGKVHISSMNRHWNPIGHQLVAKHVYGPMIEKYL